MQKTLIILIVGILAVGCLTSEQKQKALRDSVVGEYEGKGDGNTFKYVYLENGVYEHYNNGKKDAETTWSIVDGETHVKSSSGFIYVHRINTDKSITYIAKIVDGKRIDASKHHQSTYKKIK